MGRFGSLLLSAVIGTFGPAFSAAGDEVFDIVGLTDLLARLGDDAPTGLGVVVAQVEVADGTAYGPDQTLDQFQGKMFTAMSGPPGVTSHATKVAKRQYGEKKSLAPYVADIFLYEAGGWITDDYLLTGTADAPLATPGGVKLINNSWIGSIGPSTNNALRRADYVILRDELIITNGVNNEGGPSAPLLSHLYNGIAVGVRDGTHVFDSTHSGYDGPGRMKPEIVAPEVFTSYATPIINSGGSLMTETARTWPGLASNPNAQRSDVLKAVLLAGATHEDLHDGEWSNNPYTSGPDRGWTKKPIDQVVGVGTLNVNMSHMIMTGLEQDGSGEPPSSENVTWAGWDLVSVGIGESAYYRVKLSKPADEVSVLATWHRWCALPLGDDDWAIADFNIILWRVDESGDLVTLLGDDGLAYFSGGNVVSASSLDNVEHLYITGLAAGEYVIELDRMDALGELPEWEAAIAWLLPEPGSIPEDVTGDGVVDVLDLLAVLAAWGECVGCPEDINGDGVVDVLDLLAVLAAW